MILAKAKGMDTKVRAYKQSIDNLCRSLKHVMGEYENNDKKHDLKLMLMQVELLQRKMNKVLWNIRQLKYLIRYVLYL